MPAWMRTATGWFAALGLVMLLAWALAAGAWALLVILALAAAVFSNRRVRHRLAGLTHRPRRYGHRRGYRGRTDWVGVGRILASMSSLDAPGRSRARFPGMGGGPARGARRPGPRRGSYTGPDGTFYTSDARYDEDRARQRDWWDQDDYWNERARAEDRYWAERRYDDWQRW
jgi:hypothetical protein